MEWNILLISQKKKLESELEINWIDDFHLLCISIWSMDSHILIIFNINILHQIQIMDTLERNIESDELVNGSSNFNPLLFFGFIYFMDDDIIVMGYKWMENECGNRW